jgi:ABC-type sugar transport system ATPase subunit
MTAAVLAVQDVGKQYAGYRVLDAVSFALEAGDTMAVVGENGAGKSTLAKILAGVIAPDSGRLFINGHEVTLSTPRVALEHGIAFIPQELLYVPQLGVAENICLGRWPRRAGLTSAAAIRRRAAAELKRYGFDLPLDRVMASLSVAQQQMVEILKAVARRSRMIVLDEPTATLSSRDSDRLLTLMTGLAQQGVAVLYISHRLDEVFRACHTVAVLRNGRLVHVGPVAETSPREVIGQMLGRSADDTVLPKQHAANRDDMLDARNWRRKALPPLRDISFSVHRGEVVCLYGVRGSGAEVIAETLGGLHPEVTGETVVAGNSVQSVRNPRAARHLGVAYVPAERKSQGLSLTMSVQRSLAMLVLKRVSRIGIVSAGRERALAKRIASDVLLRARGLAQPVGELSGGNQQKVLVGSRLATQPLLLVLQEPTRGVDVGARLEIHRLLRKMANEGTATLLVTSDIEEAVTISDRLLVVRDGEIVHEVHKPSLGSQHDVLHAAGGGS